MRTVNMRTVNLRTVNLRIAALLPLASLAASLLLFVACGDEEQASTSSNGTGSQTATVTEIPNPDTRAMEPQVRRRIAEARRAVEAKATSASAWGRFAMVADVHELDQVALTCSIGMLDISFF